MNDDQFRRLLKEFHGSWKGYRKVRRGVIKRLRRQMRDLDCPSVEEYLRVLEKSGKARRQCERLMTVSISRFFRDRRLWDVLRREVVPNIARGNPDGVKVWSAGCACGEEAYSFKMLWSLLEKPLDGLPSLELWATDLNPDYLDRARSGIYSLGSLREVPEENRDQWFDPMGEGKRFQVKSRLRSGIIWKTHSLFEDPPCDGFDLIFLRNNCLTYFEDPLKTSIFDRIFSSLNQEGYLVLGSHEKPPSDIRELKSHPACLFLFQKV